MAQVVELDASGDFIIELSTQSSEKTCLLVSSKVLTLLSPVLGEMFERETRARAGGEKGVTTPVIPLPNDDEEVFTIICQIAHHKMEGIPDMLTPEVLAKLAATFQKILFHHVGFFPGSPYLIHHPDIINAVNARRTKLVSHLMDVMLSPLFKPLLGLCDQSAMMIGRYLKELTRLGVLPHHELYYSSVFEVLSKEIEEPIRQFCDLSYCVFCSERDFKFADELRKAKAAFVHKNDGLCLDCVRTGMVSHRKGQCRIKHTLTRW